MMIRGTCVECSEPVPVTATACPRCGCTDEPWTDFEELSVTAKTVAEGIEATQIRLTELVELAERTGYEAVTRRAQQTADALDIVVRDFRAMLEQEIK